MECFALFLFFFWPISLKIVPLSVWKLGNSSIYPRSHTYSKFSALSRDSFSIDAICATSCLRRSVVFVLESSSAICKASSNKIGPELPPLPPHPTACFGGAPSYQVFLSSLKSEFWSCSPHHYAEKVRFSWLLVRASLRCEKKKTEFLNESSKTIDILPVFKSPAPR